MVFRRSLSLCHSLFSHRHHPQNFVLKNRGTLHFFKYTFPYCFLFSRSFLKLLQSMLMVATVSTFFHRRLCHSASIHSFFVSTAFKPVPWLLRKSTSNGRLQVRIPFGSLPHEHRNLRDLGKPEIGHFSKHHHRPSVSQNTDCDKALSLQQPHVHDCLKTISCLRQKR